MAAVHTDGPVPHRHRGGPTWSDATCATMHHMDPTPGSERLRRSPTRGQARLLSVTRSGITLRGRFRRSETAGRRRGIAGRPRATTAAIPAASAGSGQLGQQHQPDDRGRGRKQGEQHREPGRAHAPQHDLVQHVGHHAGEHADAQAESQHDRVDERRRPLRDCRAAAPARAARPRHRSPPPCRRPRCRPWPPARRAGCRPPTSPRPRAPTRPPTAPLTSGHRR